MSSQTPESPEDHVRHSLAEAQTALKNMLENSGTVSAIAKAGALLTETFKNGNRAFSCGNGGSMCDAMHFAEELSGQYRSQRTALAAVSISDPSHITCVANDIGFENIFARYLEAHGKKGDCLVALSTSGKSPNILRAAETARKMGISVIGLTGKPDVPLAPLCDIAIVTPGGKFADRVQEMHIKALHIIIEIVERKMYPENY